jgi:hypothetical protein
MLRQAEPVSTVASQGAKVELRRMSGFDAVDESPQTASQNANPACGGTTASYILAFAERQELAKSRRQRAPSITTGLHPKTDVELLMSAFRLITSGVGGKAAVDRDGRSRLLLTQAV